MYVCNCEAINEKDIQKIVKKSGICSVRGLKKECAIGNGCGQCTKHASEVLHALCKKH